MSGALSQQLQRLDDFLHSAAVSDEAMLLSQLDGFLAGIVTCPELIPPSEWMPLIWGDDAPVFEDTGQAQAGLGLIMGHYNRLIADLDRRRYRPIFDFDPDDEVFWEIWMEGFLEAVRLRPEAWRNLVQTDDVELQRALFVLWRLGELATLGPGADTPMEIDEDLENLAPELIPEHVEILHHARGKQANPFTAPANASPPKVGRNDPCPCGSGKKYKKCCLA